MKLMVTGSRNWKDRAMMFRALASIKATKVVLIHGSQRGADLMAEAIALDLGWVVVPYEAEWGTHGKAAGPIRNAEMIAAKPDLVLAFPGQPWGRRSSGTWDAVGKAGKAQIPTKVFGPFALAKR